MGLAFEPAPEALPRSPAGAPQRSLEPGSRASGCLLRWQEPTPAPGSGRLAFARIDGATALVRAQAASPLQILAPRRRGRSAWAFLIGHGGGLVGGDEIELEVRVGAGAAALLTTQAETKVYRARDGCGASQRLLAHVEEGGALALLPDPISPFAGSRFDQRQRFELAADASLLTLDAVTSGRSARGERWSFDRYRTSTEIFVAGRRLLCDALALANPLPCPPARALADRLGRIEAFAAAVALGPAFAAGANALAARIAARPVERGADVIAAASPVADGVLLRCAAASAEALLAFLREALHFAAAPLGEDPFARRW